MHIFDNWFDPCPPNPRVLDGLDIEWKDKTYCNPPYSKVTPWVEKAIEESKKGKIIVMLLHVDTSTKSFAKLNESKAHFLWFAQRLNYSNKKGGASPRPSMLVILNQGKLKK